MDIYNTNELDLGSFGFTLRQRFTGFVAFNKDGPCKYVCTDWTWINWWQLLSEPIYNPYSKQSSELSYARSPNCYVVQQNNDMTMGKEWEILHACM